MIQNIQEKEGMEIPPRDVRGVENPLIMVIGSALVDSSGVIIALLHVEQQETFILIW
jgi:hypothetical protein